MDLLGTGGSVRVSTTLKPRPILKGHGGKFRLGRWLHGLLPWAEVTWDACSATASFLLSDPKPSPVEHACDIHETLYIFFKVLIDPVQGAEFERIISGTLYHESFYNHAWDVLSRWENFNGDPLLFQSEPPLELEIAIAYFIVSFMGRDHSARTKSFRFVRHNTTGGHDPAKNFANIPRIQFARNRLRGVTFRNCDMLTIMDEHDKRDTRRYFDLPYTEAGLRLYRYGWTTAQHEHFIKRILSSSGNAMDAISMDDSELYRDKLLPAGWDMQSTQARTQSNSGSMATEILWRNPACVAEWERQRK